MRKHTRFKAEIWKPVVGYEGYYEVSSHGRVRSVDRVITYVNGKRYHYKGELKKLMTYKTGYVYVRLNRNNVGKGKLVHRLVLEAFVGPAPEGMECCHNDDKKGNNHLSNLRWDTKSENQLDRVRNGIYVNGSTDKERCPRGHELSEPNLTNHSRETGVRHCLACNRAFGYLRGKGYSQGEFQKVSDQYYRKVLAGDNSRVRRSECMRGHALIDPNLSIAPTNKGKGVCLACARARSYVKHHTHLKPRLQQVSDSYYEQIMGRAAA